jgi:hypothetical protein
LIAIRTELAQHQWCTNLRTATKMTAKISKAASRYRREKKLVCLSVTEREYHRHPTVT